LRENGREIKPYTAREVIDFPAPLGKTGVYWFDMPETYTFAESFPVQNVITKFGSIPDFYNHLTWITAHIFPDAWVESSRGIEFFSQVSYRMTEVTDKFSGIGVAMLAKVAGWQGAAKSSLSSNYGSREHCSEQLAGELEAWQN
jgi:saccharopine dehydrogenase-like NADP-dependent oxidoreductase